MALLPSHSPRKSRPLIRKRNASRLSGRLARHVRFELLEQRELLATLSWSSGPALPAARTDAVAIVTPDKAVRLVGGAGTNPTEAPLLAAGSTSWTNGQRIDTVRNDLGAVRLGNSVILFGGTGGTEGSDEVLSYDYRAGDSQDLAKMSQVRYDFGFAADASGRAYAIGGIGVRADGEVWSQVERYDAASKTWKAVAPLPVPLHGSSAIGDGKGHIFVFGGSTKVDDSGIQANTYRYDVAADKWTTMAPMPTATRDSATAIDNSGAIYVLGGMTKSGATAKVQKYDPSTNAWSDETPLPQAVYSHAAVLDSQSRILVVGGFTSNGTATTATYLTQRLDQSDSSPSITTNPVVKGSLDRPYRYDVNAKGNPVPTFSLITAPGGMSIDSATGVISWQPVDGQLGNHSVTVRAANRAGSADQTFSINVVADTFAPTAPANLKVGTLTETTADLTWDAASDAVGVDHYDVYKVVHRRSRWRRWTEYTLLKTTPGSQLNATITGLAPLSTTNFIVRAIDAAGNVSVNSNEVTATTLSTPDLRFYFGSQRSGTIQGRANKPLEVQLVSRANPAATFSLVSGPTGMTVDAQSGLVKWTPAVAQIGAQTATYRATNSVGTADLTVAFNVIPDAPQLSVDFSLNTNGRRFAVAGVPFAAQIKDASSTPPTYELKASPQGMSIDPQTGVIAWLPQATQGGTHAITVRGTSAGGATDFTFSLKTHFTGPVTAVSVSGTTKLFPTAHWTAPTGAGANLVDHYNITARTRYRWGRSWRTHQVNYTAPASATQVDLTGLLTGKEYTLTITPVDAQGNTGLPQTGTKLTSTPLLPSIRWKVNGQTRGTSLPGNTVAGQPSEIVLTDARPEPSSMVLVAGPAGLTFDAATKTARWTPTAADVTSGYNTTQVRFRATNTVGSVDVVVPLRVFFATEATNLTATAYGQRAVVEWNPPAHTAKPVAGYEVTMQFKVHGRVRTRSWTIGPVNKTTFLLVPTGAVWHQGVTITPIDADGNRGLPTQRVPYADPPNKYAPIAVDDAYSATEDVPLVVDAVKGVRANDIDTDNTPYFNPLKAYVVSAPANGKISLGQTGNFTYTPNANFNGTDTFTYRLFDGKFYSNNATVTINVAAVNDTPVALDDNYTTNQDQPLSVNAANGVLANDTDVDGDTLAVRIVDQPAHGTVTLAADGSFQYTPAGGYAGSDTFTYVANDGTVDSRIAKANVVVKGSTPGTKFYVVDLEVRRTFEYTAAGKSVEDYKLAAANRKPRGATASKDGSKIWVLDKKGKVYLYDADGGTRGSWTPIGPKKFEGIATDDQNIWIVDRELDTVFFYSGAASRTSGTVAATSSFRLDPANKKPTGITSDGTSVWVVDNAALNRVFKYKTDGTLLGSWKLDAANTTPTGITIDPSNVADIWVVDSASDSVYQYEAATGWTSGQHSAKATFALNGANVNPQGIADPPAVPQTWHNPFDPFDVNNDQVLSPVDALTLVNELNESGARELSDRQDAAAYFDVNHDGLLSTVDVLAVIQALEGERIGVESAASVALDQVVEELAGNTSPLQELEESLAEIFDATSQV